MISDEKPKGGAGSPVHVGEWSGVESRQHKRVALGVPLECRSVQKVVSGRAENLSLGGLLVRVEETSFSWDEEVSVSFALPGSTEALQVRARVAHVVPDVFLGLEFLELSPPAREQIEQYVSATAAASPKRR